MATLTEIYRHSLSLLTDLYELTMAYGYWKAGIAHHEAVFHLFYRNNPFAGGYAISCGQGYARELLSTMRFDSSDLDYLASLRGNDDNPLFEDGFLAELGAARFTCEVDAIPEGTVVFPHEPIVRVKGPLWLAQVVETPLLNIINFQTLIATKAARVCSAAQGEPVLEFGLRRAQGIDGALAASRAAHVGGCAPTSNVLAGKLFGIPVRGTHAHSWVMCFETEIDSFEAYADAMPNNCVFLVDTYNTEQGVKHAVEVGKKLRAEGHEMVGVRLDSGDLAYLSKRARELLDQGGFPDASIVASNDLDERIIRSLKEQGAKITVWGVGTKLATAYDQPALGGVYKLAAIRAPRGDWHPKVKLSEQAIKTSIPGLLQVRRYTRGAHYTCDLIYDETTGVPAAPVLVDPGNHVRRRRVQEGTAYHDLLVPMMRDGAPVHDAEPIAAVRERARDNLVALHAGIQRFLHPHEYPVGLEKGLHDLRAGLILQAREDVT